MEPTTPIASDPLLLVEVRTSSRHAGASGYRILTDGRYESLHAPPKAPARWQLLRELDAAELATFRTLMAGLDLASIPAEVAPAQPVMDGGSTTWTLRVGDGLRQVKVRKGASVPALDALYAALPPPTVVAAVSTEWTVPHDGGEQTWSLPCDTSAIPEIDGITWIIAAGQAHDSGAPAASASRLLTMTWLEGGEVSSRHEVWSDGWQLIHDAEQLTGRKRHTEDEMARLRELIAAVPWHDLASRCP